MLSLVLRILVFSLWVILLGTLVAALTTWRHDLPVIDAAYEREVTAMRLVSIGEADDRRLPSERRAQVVTGWIVKQIDAIGTPKTTGRFTQGLQEGIQAMDPDDFWAHTYKPRLKRFLPIFYLRIETYLIAYVTLFPLFAICFLWGMHHGRLMMRSGVHKRNWPAQAMMWLLRSCNLIAVGATGFVFAPPVVYWMVPSFLVAAVIIVLWRSYHIELL